jgi:tRNA-2-methylthio-N6-dimethylallyladenosine synthase
MDQLPEDVKHERLQRLQEAIDGQQAAFMARCVGKTFDVLFDKSGRAPGQIVGRSPYLQPVPVIGPASLIGEIAPVTILEVRTNSLYGTLADARQPTAPALAEIGA